MRMIPMCLIRAGPEGWNQGGANTILRTRAVARNGHEEILSHADDRPCRVSAA